MWFATLEPGRLRVDQIEVFQVLINTKLSIKCHIRDCYLNYGNMDEEYKMGDDVLGRTTKRKDLGIKFSDSMNVSHSRAN